MKNRKEMCGSFFMRLRDRTVIRFLNKSDPKNVRKP